MQDAFQDFKFSKNINLSSKNPSLVTSKNQSNSNLRNDIPSVQSSVSNSSIATLDDLNCMKTPMYSTKIPKYQEKGLVFVWPQRRRFYHTKELITITWFLAHTLYLMHILHLFPSGITVPIKRPPWRYSPPLPKPENRDYIIEPDWDS